MSIRLIGLVESLLTILSVTPINCVGLFRDRRLTSS